MTKENILLLQEQVTRQNRMIDVLLKKNKDLEETVRRYQQLIQAFPLSPELMANGAKGTTENNTLTVNSIINTPDVWLSILKKIYGQPAPGSASADLTEAISGTGHVTIEKMDGNIGAGGSIFESAYHSPENKASINEKMDGNIQSIHITPDKMDGNNERKHASANLMDGNYETDRFIHEKMNGNMEPGHANVEKMYDSRGTGYTSVQSAKNATQKGDAGAKTATSLNRTIDTNIHAEQEINNLAKIAAAPAVAPAIGQDGNTLNKARTIHIARLEELVGRVIIRSNYQGLENAAKILERLEQSPKQSMKQLQNLTGLTRSGIGKRIMSMKRYGLIKRGPHRQLLLTEKARQLLEEARR